MPRNDTFTVHTDLTALTVTVRNGAVTRIDFGAGATREPDTGFERGVAQELVEYVAGLLRTFTLPIDVQGTHFDRRVWRAVQEIPYGETLTYGDVARRIGSPKAARAVGHANGRNPVPIVIPCHRVVAAGGRLGGYGGGLPLKRRLLALERRGKPDSRCTIITSNDGAS